MGVDQAMERVLDRVEIRCIDNGDQQNQPSE